MEMSTAKILSRKGATGDDEVVLLDWSITGIAPLGQDVAGLAAGSVSYLLLPPAQFPELHKAVLDAYLEGLHDVDWVGDPLHVRLAPMADVALRFGFLMASKDPQQLRFNEEYSAELQQN